MGFRYLKLKPSEVLATTLREFHLMMDGHLEAIYDRLEMASYEALMMRGAYHSDKKNLKAEDLFKRPVNEHEEKEKIESLKEMTEKQQEFLNNLQFTPDRKEGENG